MSNEDILKGLGTGEGRIQDMLKDSSAGGCRIQDMLNDSSLKSAAEMLKQIAQVYRINYKI